MNVSKISVFCIVLVVFTLVACAPGVEPEPLPEREESFLYERAGMFTVSENANQQLYFTQDGIAFTITAADGTITHRSTLDYLPNEGNFETFIAKIESLGFTQLNTEYTSQVPVADVGYGFFQYVTDQGDRYAVRVNPYVPDQHSEQIKALDSLIQPYFAAAWAQYLVPLDPQDPVDQDGGDFPLEFTPPEGCVAYYDGCNTCTATQNGLTACTERACVQYDTPYCTQFDQQYAPDERCDLVGGLWDERDQGCADVTENQCDAIGGDILCLSPCRHDPGAEVCITSCELVCVIN